MKKLTLFAVFAASLAATAADTVAWYTFDDDPLGVTDASGNFNTLTNGGVTIVDGAASFDGTAKAFSTIRPLPMNTASAYTFECFARPATTQNSAAMLIELSGNAGFVDGGAFICYPDGAMAHTSSGWTGRKLQDNILDDQWHHLAAIYTPLGTNDIANQVLFYVDGRLQDIYTQHQKGSVHLVPFLFYIGSRNNSQHAFRGLIDDVRITRGALSTNEFLKARSAGKPVVAYYPFNTPETALQDASGNGNHLTGSGVTFQDGYASFNGGSHAMNTINKLDLSAYKDVTVEFFLRNHPNVTTTRMILELSENIAGCNGCFYVTMNDSRGICNLNGAFYPGGYHIDYSANHTIDVGWHHVALVVDSARAGNDRSRLFLDGKAVYQHSKYTTVNDVNLGNQTLYVGSRANSSFMLDADIDDIRITARALMPGSFMPARSQPPEPSDVIAYWPFDRRAPLHDATENGNELENDGVTFTPEGAAAFSGTHQKFSTISTLPLYERDALTVEFFMRTTDASTVAIVLETGSDFTMSQGWLAACVNERAEAGENGRLDAGVDLCKSPPSFNIKRATNTADGKWHHYALVYDTSKTDTDIVRFYKDGEPQTAPTHKATYRTRLTSDRLFIGSRNNSSLHFVGELDDIRITGRALETSEFMKKRSSPLGVCVIFR